MEICTVFCSGGDPCKAVFVILLVNLVVQLLRTHVLIGQKMSSISMLPLKVAVV